MENIENSKMYLTVLKNISQGTPVQPEAEKLMNDFEKDINTHAIRSQKYWYNQAHKDLHDLLSNKIKMMQSIQTNCMSSILFNTIKD
jgi:hypothetical protein